MIFKLFLIREKGGVLPKWQRATHHGIRGELSLSEQKDDVFNRVSRVAVMLDEHSQAPIAKVAPLYDAQLVRLTKSLMILSGVERIHDPIINRTYDFAQTWWLEAPDAEDGA